MALFGRSTAQDADAPGPRGEEKVLSLTAHDGWRPEMCPGRGARALRAPSGVPRARRVGPVDMAAEVIKAFGV